MNSYNRSLDEALADSSTTKKSKQPLSAELKANLRKASERMSHEVEDTVQNDVYQVRQDANKSLNMVLNSLKVWTPMLTAVSSQVHAKSEEDAATDLNRIVRNCSEITTHLLGEMEAAGLPVREEGHLWVIRQLLANVSESVTRQYSMKDKVDIETTKNLLSQAISFTTGQIPACTKEKNKPLATELLQETTTKLEDLKVLFLKGEKSKITVDEDVAITCSIMKSSEAIIEQLEWFSWFSDPEIHVNRLSEKVISGAGFFYENLLEDFAVAPSRGSRLMLLQSSIDKSSKCLTAAYKKEAHQTLLAMKEEITGSDDQKTIKREQIKHYSAIGVPYDKINEAFEKSLGLHISFTKSGSEFLKSKLGGLLNGRKKHEEQERGNVPK